MPLPSTSARLFATLSAYLFAGLLLELLFGAGWDGNYAPFTVMFGWGAAAALAVGPSYGASGFTLCIAAYMLAFWRLSLSWSGGWLVIFHVFGVCAALFSTEDWGRFADNPFVSWLSVAVPAAASWAILRIYFLRLVEGRQGRGREENDAAGVPSGQGRTDDLAS